MFRIKSSESDRTSHISSPSVPDEETEESREEFIKKFSNNSVRDNRLWRLSKSESTLR